jgi:hypothetical protein
MFSHQLRAPLNRDRHSTVWERQAKKTHAAVACPVRMLLSSYRKFYSNIELCLRRCRTVYNNHALTGQCDRIGGSSEKFISEGKATEDNRIDDWYGSLENCDGGLLAAYLLPIRNPSTQAEV